MDIRQFYCLVARHIYLEQAHLEVLQRDAKGFSEVLRLIGIKWLRYSQ